MNAKEKAEELIDKFYQLFPLQKDVISIYGTLSWEYDNWKQAKQCALIAVEELIRISLWCGDEEEIEEDSKEYWQQVKKEIEKL